MILTDFRSDAEKFVTSFLDYVSKDERLCDHFDRTTQKMERSAGVLDLIKQAQSVFPARKPDGESAKEMTALSDESRDEAIKGSNNVVDTREMFSRRIAKNGGTRKLLRDLYEGDSTARERVAEFFSAEDGETEFAKE